MYILQVQSHPFRNYDSYWYRNLTLPWKFLKGLADLVMKLGLDPKDIKGRMEIIKNINVDIQALRK